MVKIYKHLIELKDVWGNRIEMRIEKLKELD